MELALVVWFISILSSLGSTLGWLSVLFIALLALLAFAAIMTFDACCESDKKVHVASRLWFFRLIPVALICLFLSVITPSTKTGWMMAGAYVGQMAVTSDVAKKLGQIVEIKLEEVLDEATEQAKIKAKSINKAKE